MIGSVCLRRHWQDWRGSATLVPTCWCVWAGEALSTSRWNSRAALPETASNTCNRTRHVNWILRQCKLSRILEQSWPVRAPMSVARALAPVLGVAVVVRGLIATAAARGVAARSVALGRRSRCFAFVPATGCIWARERQIIGCCNAWTALFSVASNIAVWAKHFGGTADLRPSALQQCNIISNTVFALLGCSKYCERKSNTC